MQRACDFSCFSSVSMMIAKSSRQMKRRPHDVFFDRTLSNTQERRDVLLFHAFEAEQHEDVARPFTQLFQCAEHVGERIPTEYDPFRGQILHELALELGR